MSDEIDLGFGYSYRTFTCEGNDDEPIGVIVTGPAAPQCKFQKPGQNPASPGRCAGGCHFENAPVNFLRKSDGSLRPTWKVVSKNPLSMTPSIKCGCDGQHGYITEGRWINAGGIVA